MLIKVTEFDDEVILVNTNAIAFVRNNKHSDLDAKTAIRLITNSKETDNVLYVKESMHEILNKVSVNPLF